MRAGNLMLLADCNGGGNNLVAWVVILIAFSAWALVTVLVVRKARDERERYLLLGLLFGSILLTPLIIYGFYSGLVGSDGNVAKLVPLLVIPSVIGVGIAHRTRAAHRGRAFFISAWGTFLIPYGMSVLFFAAFAIGTGCLE
jgi:hypothetical protein